MENYPTQSRAYVCKVPNKKARGGASKEYFQVFVEESDTLLFTETEFANAVKRAKNNPEDIVQISFVDPCEVNPCETDIDDEKSFVDKWMELMNFLFP